MIGYGLLKHLVVVPIAIGPEVRLCANKNSIITLLHSGNAKDNTGHCAEGNRTCHTFGGLLALSALGVVTDSQDGRGELFREVRNRL